MEGRQLDGKMAQKTHSVAKMRTDCSIRAARALFFRDLRAFWISFSVFGLWIMGVLAKRLSKAELEGAHRQAEGMTRSEGD
jgi:hypothetical protein